MARVPPRAPSLVAYAQAAVDIYTGTRASLEIEARYAARGDTGVITRRLTLATLVRRHPRPYGLPGPRTPTRRIRFELPVGRVGTRAPTRHRAAWPRTPRLRLPPWPLHQRLRFLVSPFTIRRSVCNTRRVGILRQLGDELRALPRQRRRWRPTISTCGWACASIRWRYKRSRPAGGSSCRPLR